MRFRYCPECGSFLTEKEAGDEGLVPFCDKCGRLWFDMFPSCVISLIYNEYNEIALLRQGYVSDVYATFNAGYMVPGETAEECMKREMIEELGFEPEKYEMIGTRWFERKGILMHCFICYVSKQDFILSDEVDSAEWVYYKDAPARMFPDSPGNAALWTYKEFVRRMDTD